MIANETESRYAMNAPLQDLLPHRRVCREVAFALDQLLANQNFTKLKEHLIQCDEKSDFWACATPDLKTKMRDRIKSKKTTLLHFRLPGDINLVSNSKYINLGHHWVVELTFPQGQPQFIHYAAFKDHYSLGEWLRPNLSTPDLPRHFRDNPNAGGAHKTVAQFEVWLDKVMDLSYKLQTQTAKCSEMNQLYTELFSATFEELGAKSMTNCKLDKPDVGRILVGVMDYSEKCSANIEGVWKLMFKAVSKL